MSNKNEIDQGGRMKVTKDEKPSEKRTQIQAYHIYRAIS